MQYLRVIEDGARVRSAPGVAIKQLLAVRMVAALPVSGRLCARTRDSPKRTLSRSGCCASSTSGGVDLSWRHDAANAFHLVKLVDYWRTASILFAAAVTP